MDFTDAYRLHASSSQRPFAYSTGSTFFATLHHIEGDSTVVQVRVSNSLQVVRTWTLDFYANAISWSRSGTLLLIAGKREWIVLSVDPSRSKDDSQGIVVRVVAGMEGLASVTWVGHGKYEAVCGISADDTLAQVYDLQRHSILSVVNPKRSRAFPSHTSHNVALLTRHNGKDGLSILTSPFHRHASGWAAEEQFALHTNDAVEAAWSPKEQFIAVREGPLEYRVAIYSPQGHLQAIFQIDSNPTLTQSIFQTLYSPSSAESGKIAGDGMGIREMKWSPSGSVLALGGYDEAVRILESSEWTMLACLDLSQRLVADRQDGTMGSLVGRQPTYRSNITHTFFSYFQIGWREPQDWKTETGGRGIVACEAIRD